MERLQIIAALDRLLQIATRLGDDSAARDAAGLRDRVHAHRFLDWLLELNVGRVESDMRERVRDGRRALEEALRSALRSTLSYAESALERVKAIRDLGSTAVTSELSRLRELRVEIDQ